MRWSISPFPRLLVGGRYQEVEGEVKTEQDLWEEQQARDSL